MERSVVYGLSYLLWRKIQKDNSMVDEFEERMCESWTARVSRGDFVVFYLRIEGEI